MKKSRVATDLYDLFAGDVGKRLTVAAIAQVLYARSVYTNRVSAGEAAFGVMWDYEEQGLVESCPGPRGGAGWRLTPKGVALLAGRTSSQFAG